MKAFLALILILGVSLLGTASFAATCKEPVSAPTYQVGDKFTWKYSNGKEKVWEVTRVDGNLAKVNWSDGASRYENDREGIYFLDQDWVIRKGVNKKGEELLSPKIGAFSMIGIKDLDFPLRMGKTWSFKFLNRAAHQGIYFFYMALKVIGCEEVVTPAGKFLALKIEISEENASSVMGGSGTIYRWYSPEAKNIVKTEFGRWLGNFYNPNWSTIPLDYELTKLELR